MGDVDSFMSSGIAGDVQPNETADENSNRDAKRNQTIEDRIVFQNFLGFIVV